jgi:hypothetical protein
VFEVAGYVVWGLTGVVIAVPEIWAAADGRNVPWPTISGTIGYLEYWHTWVAVIVIGILVWAIFHSVKYSAGVAGPTRTKGGRWTPGTPKPAPAPHHTLLVVTYYAVAVACVIAGPLIVLAVRPHDKYLLGEVLYGLIGFFGMVVPSVVALVVRRDVPFPTLFWTIQRLEQRVRPIAIVFAAGITVLVIHLALYPWPSVIPDLQDLHKKSQQLKHQQKKQREPSPYAG